MTKDEERQAETSITQAVAFYAHRQELIDIVAALYPKVLPPDEPDPNACWYLWELLWRLVNECSTEEVENSDDGWHWTDESPGRGKC